MTKKLSIALLLASLAACAGTGTEDLAAPDEAEAADVEPLSLVVSPGPTPIGGVPHYCYSCSQQLCDINCYNGYLKCLYAYGYNTPETSAICSKDLQNCESSCDLCCSP